ncbi:unnamed protein product [Adineta steineri]|uniref:MutL C-terminal dimerisation domain-containing protein n=1 Tax=Adineta steineri TaxID=433720 RepID=A0A818P4T0_9BILA|nr:unnamed protein product [Adineta steineri]
MSIDSNLLERYHAARAMCNTVNDQLETLYHKRQRITIENSRTDAYKYTLIQSKRREWSVYKRNTTHHQHQHPVRLSTNIRQIFQVTEQNQQQSSDNSYLVVNNTLPPRIYPTIFNIQQMLSKQSVNINILHEIYFLGQFDKKFLVTKRFIHSSNINKIQIILFDQHAISERILLEQLQKENIHSISFRLSQPITIPRNPRFIYTPEQISLLERTGFKFSSISTHNLLVRSVPNWLLTLKQRESSTCLLDNIISSTINNILLLTINNQSKLIMYETLKSLACHNAIKFNDILSKNECNHLLNELKSCSMPFICAHGRTSASILCEYNIITDDYHVDMAELKQLASIHKWLKKS